jgi:hypothetical protein
MSNQIVETQAFALAREHQAEAEKLAASHKAALLKLYTDHFRAEFAPKAGQGALLLNQWFPHWHLYVDGKIHNICKGNRCTLGQIFGDYDRGLEILRLSSDDGFQYGFNIVVPKIPRSSILDSTALEFELTKIAAEIWSELVLDRSTELPDFI